MSTEKNKPPEVDEILEKYLSLFEALIGKRILKLPAPLGARVYVPYEYAETDGTIVRGIEETGLAGYINEDGRPFYLCYDSVFGSSDVAPSDLFLTREAAEAALKERIS